MALGEEIEAWREAIAPSGFPRPRAEGEKYLVDEVFLLLFVHKKKTSSVLSLVLPLPRGTGEGGLEAG